MYFCTSKVVSVTRAAAAYYARLSGVCMRVRMPLYTVYCDIYDTATYMSSYCNLLLHVCVLIRVHTGVPIHTVITAVAPRAAPAVASATEEENGKKKQGHADLAAQAHASDALVPGLERLAFEFCGRDAGRMVEAASRGGGGIRQLISDVCPPDFRMLEVGVEEEASTPVRASASQQQASVC